MHVAIESIPKTLGGASGIDTAALVKELVEKQFEYRNARLKKREETLTAQISGAATHKSNITSFANAVAGLARGGTLATQPTSSNTSILNVSRLSGANLTTLNARIEVRQLAASQTAHAAPVADKAAAIGQGKLTLTLGTGTVSNGAMTGFTPGTATPVDITIDATNSSLEGIANAINAANAGVSASILTDAAGSRLVVKGATGVDRAFTLTATETPGQEGLAALNIGVGATGTTIGSAAADALVAIDGVQLKRESNTINDLIPGVKIDLNSAQPGTIVTIGKPLPTTALTNAVQDFVATYNELFTALRADLHPETGSLRTDLAARELRRQLQQLTMSPIGDGALTKLAEIGVKTNRDGTLMLDNALLTKALVNNPEAVEKMFAEPKGNATTGNGLVTALNAIASAATNTERGLGASEASYNKAKGDLAKDKADVLAKTEDVRLRMTRQFASMDAKVAVYKKTQDFLKNQIDAWNNRG
ncbi:flagellar hook protein [Sphingomonas koreensis]|nr:flagellar hook protein [Sphingomonas koreensis]RSX57885.1 flagellar hook protein [Sphingomonas koreensis]RSX74234.1 flagellar hook protein [Sphingomonas koreensis]RSX80406.1 flagellar hook protein [Sphingomonas koreensis]RSY29166.1 flagellar hook protein [Sphingomonas koreensis]